MIKGKLLIPNGSKPFDGKYILGHDGSNLRFSSDGGLTFATLSIPVNAFYNVRATMSGDGRYIRIVGTGGNVSNFNWHAIIGSDDYGAYWSDISTQGDLGAIKMSNNGIKMVATLRGSYDYSIYQTHNLGYGGWNVASYGVTKNGMTNLAMTDDGDYLFAASDIQYATYPITSETYGQTWVDQVTISSNRCSGVAMSSSGWYRLIVYTPESSSSAFYVSSNQGSSYTQITNPMNTWAADPCVSHSGQYMCFTEAMGDIGVFVSTNYGSTWAKHNFLPDYGQLMFPFSNENIWLLFPYMGSGYYRSENAGSSWTYVATGHNLYCLAINKFNL